MCIIGSVDSSFVASLSQFNKHFLLHFFKARAEDDFAASDKDQTDSSEAHLINRKKAFMENFMERLRKQNKE